MNNRIAERNKQIKEGILFTASAILISIACVTLAYYLSLAIHG